MPIDPTLLLATAPGDSALRAIHLVAAMLAVGALVFQRVALRPALDEGGSPELAEAVRRRWAPWVHGTILVLLATGFWRFFTVGMAKAEGVPGYHMLVGIKILAAFGVFFVASALIGTGSALARFRAAGRRTLTIGILLALVVIAISLHLREIQPASAGAATADPAAELPAGPGGGDPPRGG